MDEKLFIKLSAYADNELPAIERAAVEKELRANAKLAAQIRTFKCLDDAARAMKVPNADDKLSSMWQPLSELTIAFPPGVLERLDQAAANMPVPQISDANAAQTWKKIESKVSQTPAAPESVPQVSEQKWNRTWEQISDRAQIPHEKKIVKIDFSRPKQSTGWWKLAASVAATLVLGVLVWQTQQPMIDTADSDAPEVLDDEYRVHVEFVEGKSNPFVCFYLQPDDMGFEN